MGQRKRISFLIFFFFSLIEIGETEYGMKGKNIYPYGFYVSLIENGDTKYGMEGKNLLHYGFVYLSYRKWRD